MPAVASSSKPRPASACATGRDRGLVGIADRQEGRAAGRERTTGRALGLREGGGRVGGARHHLAGRAHLGPEHRVGAGEAGERQHGGLDADQVRARAPPAARARSGAPAARRQAASTRLTPVALLAKGTVRDARGLTSSTYTLAVDDERAGRSAGRRRRAPAPALNPADLGVEAVVVRRLGRRSASSACSTCSSLSSAAR